MNAAGVRPPRAHPSEPIALLTARSPTLVLNAGVEGAVRVYAARQNAASIAGLRITIECVIADKPEEDVKGGGDMY